MHKFPFRIGLNFTDGDRDVKKIVSLALISSVLLSGCAMFDKSRDPALNSISGLSLDNNGEYEYIKSYVNTSNGKFDENKIKICAIRTISNDGVTLNGSSSVMNSSMVTGMYIQNSTTTSGGEVVDSNASTSNDVVTSGTTSYFANVIGMPIEFAVKFTLDMSGDKSHIKYTFSNIKQAQKNTGAMSNTGFYPVGSWVGANPEEVVKSLSKISDDMSSCLSS